MDFKKFLPWIIAAVVLIGIYSWVKGINNTAVTLGQTVEHDANSAILGMVNKVKHLVSVEETK